MAQLAQATVWGAPLVQQPTHQVASRAVTVHYRLGEHFRVIEHNHGRKSERIPIYVATPGLIAFDHASPDRWPCTRADVPNVPGAFVLSNVLTPHECEQLLADSEAMGYCEDAPGSLGRDIRHNESCTWMANVTITSPIYQRVARLLPPEVAGGAVVGINRPFRLYKYNTDDVFRAHTDGSWPGTGVVNGLVATDVYGRAGSSGASVDPGSCDVDAAACGVSDRDGARGRGFVSRGVKVAQGGVLCFYHGQHPLSPLHEGSMVTAGTKYVVRSDVTGSDAG